MSLIEINGTTIGGSGATAVHLLLAIRVLQDSGKPRFLTVDTDEGRHTFLINPSTQARVFISETTDEFHDAFQPNVVQIVSDEKLRLTLAEMERDLGQG